MAAQFCAEKVVYSRRTNGPSEVTAGPTCGPTDCQSDQNFFLLFRYHQVSAYNKAGSSLNSTQINIAAADRKPQERLLIWTRRYVAKLDYDLKVRLDNH